MSTQKMIIIGALIFLGVVAITLAITLPIVLRNKDGKTNNSANNSTTTNSSVSNNTTMMAASATSQAPAGSRQLDEIPLEDESSSIQIEPIRLVIDKARGLFKRSLVPLLYNFDDGGDENEDP